MVKRLLLVFALASCGGRGNVCPQKPSAVDGGKSDGQRGCDPRR